MTDERRKALGECFDIAKAEAQKMRDQAAECPAWSAAQAERFRARDTAENIADAIAALCDPAHD